MAAKVHIVERIEWLKKHADKATPWGDMLYNHELALKMQDQGLYSKKTYPLDIARGLVRIRRMIYCGAV